MDKTFDHQDYANQLGTQLRKGFLAYCVLLLCSKGDVYSSEIIERLRDGELVVVEGTMYPLLSRLQKDGLLTHDWQESLKGPPRKYYRISDDGRAVLRELEKITSQLQEAINSIKKA